MEFYHPPRDQRISLFWHSTDDFSFPAEITPSVIRHIAGPDIEFSPDALLPMCLDEPEEVEKMLAAGADPNHQPETIYDGVACGVMGRLPIVLGRVKVKAHQK